MQIGQIVKHTSAPVSNFYKYELHWVKNLIEKLHNQFWKEVCISWLIFLQKGSIKNRKEIMSSALWFNPEISNAMLFFQSGIITAPPGR